jgi:hypothetical protein
VTEVYHLLVGLEGLTAVTEVYHLLVGLEVLTAVTEVYHLVGLEVLTAVVMKSSVSWDIVNRESQLSSACCARNVGFLLSLFYHPEYGGHMILRNVDWLSSE